MNKDYIHLQGVLKGPIEICHSHIDGDCTWKDCPQLKQGEPEKSGRCCPYVSIAEHDFSYSEDFDEYLKDLPSYPVLGANPFKEGEILEGGKDFKFDWPFAIPRRIVAIPLRRQEQPSPEHTKEMLDLIRYCASKGFYDRKGTIYYGDTDEDMTDTPEQILEDFKNQQKEK